MPKDKLLKIRADEQFLIRLEYLRRIYGFADTSKTVRWVVDKEYRKETDQVNQEN